jgi:hypothetical protein
VKVLFFLIKVWNMKNVSIWFQQKPIPQLSMFCLIQGINNYVQINTFEIIYIVVPATRYCMCSSKIFWCIPSKRVEGIPIKISEINKYILTTVLIWLQCLSSFSVYLIAVFNNRQC